MATPPRASSSCERYIRLAHKLARRYARSSEPLEDLEQVACLGLVRAIDRFDPARHDLQHVRGADDPRRAGATSAIARGPCGAARAGDSRPRSSMPPTRGELGAARRSRRSPSGRAVGRARDGRARGGARVPLRLDRPAATRRRGGRRRDAGRPAGRAGRRAEPGRGRCHARPARGGAERARPRVCGCVRARPAAAEIADRIGVSQMQVSRILRDAVDRLQAAAA